MSAPDEIEFFTGTGTGTGSSILSDDDAVDLGHGSSPRWAFAIGLLGVAVLLAGLAKHSGHEPRAGSTFQPTIQVESPTATSGLGAPIPIKGVSPAIEVGGSVPLYLLQPGHVYRFSNTSAFGVTLDGPGFAGGTTAQLVVDAAANRVWAVEMDTPGGEIVEFDARNLHRLRTMHSPDSVGDAAALGGHLYLAAAAVGVTDIAPGATRPKLIDGLSGYVASVAADPRRGRLLALVLGARTTIRVLPVGGSVRNIGVDVPLAKGNLGVTQDGAIWVAGSGPASRGAIMVRLDPRTLQPRASSLVVNELGPGGFIESAGDRDVWVRRSGDFGRLWCVDGRSGTVLQYWPQVPGAVTSHRGAAYALEEGALVPLVLTDCGG